jgi:hypothetical protein
MRVLGWLTSAVGVIGVVACNGLVPLLWVLRSNLRGRAVDLLAVPNAGLDAADLLTDKVADWLEDAAGRLDDIKVKADDLARSSDVDASAAADLASAIDGFITGPYATLRTVYAGLRERAQALGDLLAGVASAVPVLSIGGGIAERLGAIDARMLEIDASITSLGQLGSTGLAEPGVAATVAERAVVAQEHVRVVGELLAEVEAWLLASRDRVADADRRAARYLNAGAVIGTALAFFVAWLNVLLFQLGRRWSGRQFSDSVHPGGPLRP